MWCGHLCFTSIEFQEFFFQLFARLFELSLFVGMILFQFVEFGMQLKRQRAKKKYERIWNKIKTWQIGWVIPLFRCPSVRPPFPSHGARTFVAFHPLCSAIQPNDSSVSLRMFAETRPAKTDGENTFKQSNDGNVLGQYADLNQCTQSHLPVYYRCQHRWIPFARDAFDDTIRSVWCGFFRACLPYWCESAFHVAWRNRNDSHFRLRFQKKKIQINSIQFEKWKNAKVFSFQMGMGSFTLYGAPWILACTHRFIAHSNEIGAADNGKRHMAIHRCVHLRHGFIVGGKLIDVHPIRWQLLDNFRFEALQFGLRNGVGLCNDRYDIDFGVQFFHAHQIQWFQTMAGGTNEIQANMDATIVAARQRTLNFQFLLQIRFKLWIDVVNDGLEWIILVDLIAVADRIANGQFQADTTLLQLVGVRFKFDIW